MVFIGIAASVAALAFLDTRVLACMLKVFPVPDTPYLVKWSSQELVDYDRPDPFNSSHPRRTMITRLTPVPRDECTKVCREPYMSPILGNWTELVYGSVMIPYGWPARYWTELEVEVCCEDKGIDHKFPTAVWSHGLNHTRTAYTGVAQNLAGLGYDIILLDHTYEATLVEFPNGDLIEGGRILYAWNESDPDAPEMGFATGVRAKDMSFVLDYFNVTAADKPLAMGWSLGGATALQCLLSDDRWIAGANLDGTMYGTMYGENAHKGAPRPYLLFSSSTHTFEIDLTFRYFWNLTVTQHPEVWIKNIRMEGNSTHAGGFTDLALLGEMTGLRESNDALREMLFGNINGYRAVEMMREYVSDFYQFVAGNADEGLLKGPSETYPEITFVREHTGTEAPNDAER